MIRQMIRPSGRNQIKTIRNTHALVVADPDLKGFVNQLPGALREGQHIEQLLKLGGYTVTPLLRKSPSDIIQALFSSDYKVIHLAGHGIFNADPLKPSGMLIGDNVFLSSREIAQMSHTPELVFVNCCFLGQTDGVAEEYFRHRYKLAANLGTQLIDNGVKAVVVAGWAVDDGAALEFAETFYAHLFAGETFGNAVQKARAGIYQNYPSTNTWGAYQCYGDPFYRLTTNTVTQAERKYSFVIPEEAEVELFNLRSEIEMANIDPADAMKRLAAITHAIDHAGVREASITELEAMICIDLYDYDAAIKKFESLTHMENATFSVVAMEKYCNIRAKKYVADIHALLSNETKSAIQKRSRRRAIISQMNEVIADLQSLLTLGYTAERLGLMGGAYKRLSMVEETKSKKIEAYKNAAYYYQQAHAFKSNPYPVYTLTNWIALESLLVLLKEHAWGTDVKLHLKTYKLPAEKSMVDELKRMTTDVGPLEDTDYWNYLSAANLCFTQFLLEQVHPGRKQHTLSYNQVATLCRKAWKQANSTANKMAEVEHLDFLIDGYTLSTSPAAKAIRKEIGKLKSELIKQI